MGSATATPVPTVAAVDPTPTHRAVIHTIAIAPEVPMSIQIASLFAVRARLGLHGWNRMGGLRIHRQKWHGGQR